MSFSPSFHINVFWKYVINVLRENFIITLSLVLVVQSWVKELYLFIYKDNSKNDMIYIGGSDYIHPKIVKKTRTCCRHLSNKNK